MCPRLKHLSDSNKSKETRKYAVFTAMTPDWELAETAQQLVAVGYDGWNDFGRQG